jgi:bifunctional DNase/RNase
MTHDLLRDVVGALGEARDVRITDLRDKTFFAELVVTDRGGAEQTVSCRPSDGIAFALRAQIPILVEESLMLQPPTRSEEP